MREYAAARAAHERELKERKTEILIRIPEFRALDAQIPTEGVQRLRLSLGRGSSDVSPAAADPGSEGLSLRSKAARITARKKELLISHGYPADYLEPVYDCSLCHDTGYTDGKKCRCLIRRQTQILYHQSHLQEIIKTENFSALSEEYYRGEDLLHFQKAEAACRRFVAQFGKTYQNLYFCGTVGTGKSFLSACIADRLLAGGCSVIYYSAASLFDSLASLSFGRASREELEEFTTLLYRCDLLIIDDLGTELTNSFVASALFNCLNERHLNRKPTIISTNLSLQDLQSRYSDRVFSRIANQYEMYKLTGPDIRVLKRRK